MGGSAEVVGWLEGGGLGRVDGRPVEGGFMLWCEERGSSVSRFRGV